MEKFIIEGGVPLSGTVVPAGNKNGALPILAAALLTSEPVTLRNVPAIADVETMIELLAELGAEIDRPEPGVVVVTAADVNSGDVDRQLSEDRCSPVSEELRCRHREVMSLGVDGLIRTLMRSARWARRSTMAATSC